MNNSKINKKIALLLGFRPYSITVNGVKNADFGWQYPAKYADQACSVPARTVPDFVGIIESQIEFGKHFYMSAILKRDYGTKPKIEDIETLIDLEEA